MKHRIKIRHNKGEKWVWKTDYKSKHVLPEQCKPTQMWVQPVHSCSTLYSCHYYQFVYSAWSWWCSSGGQLSHWKNLFPFSPGSPVTLTYEWAIVLLIAPLPTWQGGRNPTLNVIKLGAISWLNLIRSALTLGCFSVASLTWFTCTGRTLFLFSFTYIKTIQNTTSVTNVSVKEKGNFIFSCLMYYLWFSIKIQPNDCFLYAWSRLKLNL